MTFQKRFDLAWIPFSHPLHRLRFGTGTVQSDSIQLRGRTEEVTGV